MKINLKTGDTWPYVEATLATSGTVIPLTGCTVTFVLHRRLPTPVLVVSKQATIVDAAQGKVRYRWEPADTATAGEYYGEFIVVFPDGARTTIPNDRFIEVTILKSLATP